MRSATRSAALLAIAGLSLIALAGFALSAGSGARAQTTTTIQVGDVWFCSVSSADGVCETTVSAGDTVTWDWVGALFHSTTACSGSDFATCDAAQGWDSPVQDSGSFTQTFTTAGTFYYKCLVHPGPPVPGPFMRGAITVLAAEPTPTPTSTPTPTLTPQASPQVLSAEPTPSAGPAPVDVQPVAVPAGGGEPPSNGGASAPWWWALAAGGLLVAMSALALRRLHR
jgi:plastocyanin